MICCASVRHFVDMGRGLELEKYDSNVLKMIQMPKHYFGVFVAPLESALQHMFWKKIDDAYNDMEPGHYYQI